MDPINNPIPTPNPTPNPVPPTPVPPVQPVQPVPPVPPVQPVQPVAPNPAPMTMPNFETPVAPVVQPTVPIMKPEPAPEPDPVEEELKAPMRAAAPVPGSIGSAVSMTTDGVSEAPIKSATNPFARKQTPSVAFNDPAEQPVETATQGGLSLNKKNNNRMTLYILIGVAAVVIVALIIMLIMQMTANNNAPKPMPAPVVDTSKEEEEEEQPSMLSCRRSMTAEEMVAYAPATTGTIAVDATYDEEMNLKDIKETKTTSTPVESEDASGVVTTEVESQELVAEELTVENAPQFYLELDKNGAVPKTFGEMLANYESLDFVCEAL